MTGRGRSRRGVKFPHNNNANGAEGRRASLSDVSEEGSPTKARPNGASNAQEVCCPACVMRSDFFG